MVTKQARGVWSTQVCRKCGREARCRWFEFKIGRVLEESTRTIGSRYRSKWNYTSRYSILGHSGAWLCPVCQQRTHRNALRPEFVTGVVGSLFCIAAFPLLYFAHSGMPEWLWIGVGLVALGYLGTLGQSRSLRFIDLLVNRQEWIETEAQRLCLPELEARYRTESIAYGRAIPSGPGGLRLFTTTAYNALKRG